MGEEEDRAAQEAGREDRKASLEGRSGQRCVRQEGWRRRQEEEDERESAMAEDRGHDEERKDLLPGRVGGQGLPGQKGFCSQHAFYSSSILRHEVPWQLLCRSFSNYWMLLLAKHIV